MLDTIQTIKNLTEQNSHTEATLLLAKKLGVRDFIKRADAIYSTHLNQGYLTLELNDRRYSLLKEMLEVVKERFGEHIYKKVYMSF